MLEPSPDRPAGRAFFAWLEEVAVARDSLLCVGLDPRADQAATMRDECFRLIDATAGSACAFKPNCAFFEAAGAAGLGVLREVIAHVPAGIPVILDAKRGDIADTAEAYARAAFDELGAHAVTVSPYLGGEALVPFLRRPGRGVFVLCRTSNPGAAEFQDLDTVSGGGAPTALFEVVAAHAERWASSRGNVGLVVGASDPDALARVRAVAPDLWLLIPGIGAQGGDLRQALAAASRPDGRGLIVSVSRSLAAASDPRAEARRLRDEINREIERSRSRTERVRVASGRAAAPLAELARDLIETGCVRFGQFTLRSGVASPIYLDLRRLVAHPAALRRAARAYAEKLRGLTFDRLAGIPYAGLPIATMVSQETDRPLIYPRREAKDYGTGAAVEGEYAAGETAVIIDDLATTGGTKLEAIGRLAAAGLVIHDIVVLIDRGQGARETLAAAGFQLHAVVTLGELLEEWRRCGAISPERIDEVAAFLKRHAGAG